MRATTLRFLGAWAFVERNFRASRRYWGWEIAWLAYSVVTVLAVTYIAPGMQALTGAPASDINFLTIYLLIGTLVWAFLADVFDSTAFMVGWERWEGTIEYTFMAPIRLATMLLGSSVFSVAYAALRTMVVFAVAMLFFKIDLGNANILTAMIFLATGSIGFLGVGLMASTLPLMYVERGSQMTVIVSATLLLVSGIYYPISVLPGWLQAMSWVSPARYVLEGIRAGILDGRPITELGATLWPLVLISVVTVPLGVWIFGVAATYAKRTGRLKRTG